MRGGRQKVACHPDRVLVVRDRIMLTQTLQISAIFILTLENLKFKGCDLVTYIILFTRFSRILFCYNKQRSYPLFTIILQFKLIFYVSTLYSLQLVSSFFYIHLSFPSSLGTVPTFLTYLFRIP
jgi:hypothetical protein